MSIKGNSYRTEIRTGKHNIILAEPYVQPTPTPTPTFCSDGCVTFVRVLVTLPGDVTYLNCLGEPYSQSVTIGYRLITPIDGTCVDITSLGGDAEYTVINTGVCCQPPITPTPTSTTTPTQTQTPTTTPTPTTIYCDSTVNYTGGVSYPTANRINMGPNVGQVALNYNAYNVPDRFIVIYDSNFVIDTGYRGDSTYSYGGGSRASFNNALNGKLDPITNLTYPNASVTDAAPDGYPYVNSPSSGTEFFNKETSTTYLDVNVYAPISGTAWRYGIDCPTDVTPTPTTTPTQTQTPTETPAQTETPTNTPTQTNTPSQTSSPLPVFGLDWTTTVNNQCDPNPWVISNNNQTIRYNIVDSFNCGGTCTATQSGTATATITVGPNTTWMSVDFEGIGELQDPNYELIEIYLNDVLIADAHAAGGKLGCQMGPVVKNYIEPSPYMLEANNVYELFIVFTTNDGLFHVGSYYQIDLGFTIIGPTPTPTTTPTSTITPTITPTMTPTSAYPCSAVAFPNVGSTKIYEGTTFSGSGTGGILYLNTSANLCNVIIVFDTNLILGMFSSPFNYVLNIDNLVNNLILAVSSVDIGESISIVSNAGSTELIPIYGCNYLINGNTISPNPSNSHLYVKVSGSTNYSSITFSGDGGSGIFLGICTDSIPTPSPTPTNTPTQTITPTAYGTAIQLSTPQGDGCDACRQVYGVTAYRTPSDPTPTIGDFVYSNNTLTNYFNGGNLWWKTSWADPTIYSIQIGTNGIIVNITTCSSCPSQTPTPTQTSTPTPTPSEYFYYANIYSCANCGGGPIGYGARIKFSSQPLQTWYSDGIYAFELQSSFPGIQYDYDGDLLAYGDTCFVACM